MKNNLKHLVLGVFAAAMLGIFSISAGAEGLGYEYGYESLTSTEQEVYKRLDAAVSTYAASFSLNSNNSITKDALVKIIELYSADHPEKFWFRGSFAYGMYTSGKIAVVKPQYHLNGAVVTDSSIIKAANAKFTEKTNAVIAELESTEDIDTDYEKALWLHDKVLDLVEYVSTSNDQTAYGALVEGKAVCAGYSRLYQCLLDKAGLPAWTVKGNSANPITGVGQAHAWNLMWIDGDCVYTDTTWDDQGKEKFHLYFANDLTTMKIDHAESSIYTTLLPQCTESCSHHGYFKATVPNGTMSTFNTNTMKAVLDEAIYGRTWQAVFVDTTGNGFNNWFTNSSNRSALINSVAKYSGGYSFNTRSVGNSSRGVEVHFRMDLVLDETQIPEAKISSDRKCDITVSVSSDDRSRDALLWVAFYDSKGKFLSAETSCIENYNNKYTANLPDGATSYKAMVLENETISPLCRAQGGNIK